MSYVLQMGECLLAVGTNAKTHEVDWVRVKHLELANRFDEKTLAFRAAERLSAEWGVSLEAFSVIQVKR